MIKVYLDRENNGNFEFVRKIDETKSSIVAAYLFFFNRMPKPKTTNFEIDINKFRDALKKNKTITKNAYFGASGYLFVPSSLGIYKFIPTGWHRYG